MKKQKYKLSELTSRIRLEVEKILREEEEDGFDTSYDKIHDDLANIQREMTKLFADFKENKIQKDQYVAKRKELQKKRDTIERQL